MRRRTALAAALPLTALGVVAAVVVASGGSSEGEAGAGAGASARAGTAVVARRTLVARAQLDGTLGYGSKRSAMDRLGGTVTWLPAAGRVIHPGQRLFAIDGEPVILMDGTVPAWRALSAGVTDGVDVRQLERNLAALGYDPGTVDEVFTAATASAVGDWQEANGLARTGGVELGRVVFLPGPRRVATLDTSLGGSGASANSPATWDGSRPAYAYADYTGTTATPPPATTPTAPSTTPTTPSTTPTTPTQPTTPAPPVAPADGDDESASEAPASDGDRDSDGGGGGAASATKILTTTSTVRVVTVDLDAADQALAKVGVRALVTLPDGSRVGGRIAGVGTVASAGGSDETDPGAEQGDPTVPLTIRLRSARAVRRLDEAPVTVELTTATRRDVLAVPVAALVARSGGGYGVRVVRGASAVTVSVRPGLFADGYVEIEPGAVRAGERVSVPR